MLSANTMERAVVSWGCAWRCRVPPKWRLSWLPEWGVGGAPGSPPPPGLQRPRVAVLREEGSNGDREMASAVYAAGASPPLIPRAPHYACVYCAMLQQNSHIT